MSTTDDNVDLTPEQQEANAAAAPKSPKRRRQPGAALGKAFAPAPPAAPIQETILKAKAGKLTKADTAKMVKAKEKPAKAPAAVKAPKTRAKAVKAPGAAPDERAARSKREGYAGAPKTAQETKAAQRQRAATKPAPVKKTVTINDGPKPATKADIVLAALRSPNGANSDELMKLTGWQAHSLRGFMAGTLKKKLKHDITSEKVDGRGRVYRLVEAAKAPAADDEAIG